MATEGVTIKDSGKREEFTTGSRRDTREGKGRYDLLSPISLKRLAVHMENGIKKYGERNWEKGQPLMRYLDSALRHIQVYIEGNREEDHMAAAMWNIHGFIHTQTMIERGELPKELDDVPSGYLTTPKCPPPEPPVPPSAPVSPVYYDHRSLGYRRVSDNVFVGETL